MITQIDIRDAIAAVQKHLRDHIPGEKIAKGLILAELDTLAKSYAPPFSVHRRTPDQDADDTVGVRP